MADILYKKMKTKRAIPFVLSRSVTCLNTATGKMLPTTDEIYKFISFSGGIASVSFIKWVAEKEPIEELTASTLRIGEKQFRYLSELYTAKKLKSATFFISSVQKTVDTHSEKYRYYERFCKVCKKNKWKNIVVNNHSKVLLMRTACNFYVLETSSNLNENPKIEQYSFENNQELYDFYYNFFTTLELMTAQDDE